MLFGLENASDEVRELYLDLIRSTDGSEPCFDPLLVGKGPHVGDSVTDMFVERYTYFLSRRQAAELCAGCHVIEKCRLYAVTAKEARGVWGGTTPAMRGIPRNYKGK